MTQTNQTHSRLRYVVIAWVVWGLMGSYTAAQDGLKLSGLWVEPVTVLGIERGQVRYQIASGRVLTRSIENLEGLKLGRYPDLARAELAIDRGDDAQAAERMRKVLDVVEAGWVRWSVGKRLIEVQTRLGEAEAAAGIYIDMVISGADLGFTATPPVDVIARADVVVRQRIVELAERAKGTVGPEREMLLERLIEAAGQPGVVPVSESYLGESPTAGPKVDGLVLSASVPPGTAAKMFQRGSYEQMLKVADESLSQPGKTASELYLKGMAQLALAEQSGDTGVYKSAGLSFMRVLVYFPRSAVAGPATLEAGYVHEQIGRVDIAAKLYDRAGPLIDPREDPAYYQRLSQRREAVAEAIAGE